MNLGDHSFKLFLISSMCTCMFWKTYACTFWDFLGGSDGKESACNVGDPGLIPGSGRASGEGMATHSSILTCEIPWTQDPYTHIYTYIDTRRYYSFNSYMYSFSTASFCFFFNAVNLKSIHGVVCLIKILTIKHILLRFISCLSLEKTWCGVFS